jgi:hypothetical protein
MADPDRTADRDMKRVVAPSPMGSDVSETSSEYDARTELQEATLPIYLESIGWELGDYLGAGNFNTAYEVYRIPGSAPGFPGVAIILITHAEDMEEDVSDIWDAWEDQKSGKLPTDHVARIYDIGTYMPRHNYAILEKVVELSAHIEQQLRVLDRANHYDGVSDELTSIARDEFYYKTIMDIHNLTNDFRASGWVHEDPHIGNLGYIDDHLVYIDLESVFEVEEEYRNTAIAVDEDMLIKIAWFDDDAPEFEKAKARYLALPLVDRAP